YLSAYCSYFSKEQREVYKLESPRTLRTIVGIECEKASVAKRQGFPYVEIWQPTNPAMRDRLGVLELTLYKPRSDGYEVGGQVLTTKLKLCLPNDLAHDSKRTAQQR